VIKTTKFSDLFSFGIILWEILTREKPYPNYVDPQLFANAVCFNFERPPLPVGAPEALKRLISKCWHNAPSQRCSFNEIVFSLSEIMVDCVIENDHASQFWKKYFLEPSRNLDEKVEWYAFEECICREIQFEPFEGSTFFEYLMPLLVADDPEREFVSMDRFYKIVKWFGPFFDVANGQNIIAGINELMRQSWFHGDISSIVANSLLGQKPEGTFLIRFSSADPKVNPFTLSMVQAGHVRIERTNEGFKVQGKHYRSLPEFVESNKGILKYPCPKGYVENYASDAPGHTMTNSNDATKFIL